jgi:hypothetical protein
LSVHLHRKISITSGKKNYASIWGMSTDICRYVPILVEIGR